jgi:hypothetical protein
MNNSGLALRVCWGQYITARLATYGLLIVGVWPLEVH